MLLWPTPHHSPVWYAHSKRQLWQAPQPRGTLYKWHRIYADWTHMQAELLIGGPPDVICKSLNTFACRHLRFLNLSGTGLVGKIPIEFGRCVNLVVLDLAENDASRTL